MEDLLAVQVGHGLGDVCREGEPEVPIERYVVILHDIVEAPLGAVFRQDRYVLWVLEADSNELADVFVIK